MIKKLSHGHFLVTVPFHEWNVAVELNRPVAPIGRAPVSKTGCWGFESLQAC